MLTSALTRHPLEPPRLTLRRSLLRHQIRAVVAGKRDDLALELDDRQIDPASLIALEAAHLEPRGPHLARLSAAIERSGLAAAVADGINSPDPAIRVRSARIAGTMQMEWLVPGLTPLTWAGDRAVQVAATRALGRIGGVRSAAGLIAAIQRVGSRPMLIIALSRAAPDLYLESILNAGQPRGAQAAVALAIGLRRRRSGFATLVGQLESGSNRVRMVSCRALGWIGSPSGIPFLTSALGHPDWRIRLSAAKALAMIDHAPGAELRACVADRNHRVHRAALNALRIVGRSPIAAKEPT